MSYKNIISVFVKKELQKTAWKNRVYIERLRDIELFALGKYCSTGAGHIQSILKCRYPRQWKAIWQELNPKEYQKDVEFEKKERERGKREKENRKREKSIELKRLKAEWKKAGGRI